MGLKFLIFFFLLLIIGLAYLIIAFSPKVVFIEDPFFSVIKKPLMINCKFTETKKIYFETLSNKRDLELYIKNIDKKDYIIFSPLVSQAIVNYSLEEIEHDGFFIGMDVLPNSFFDFILENNPLPGWIEAANDKSFQIGLVWNEKNDDLVTNLLKNIKTDYINEYFQQTPVESTYYSETIDSMKKKSVVEVLCPGAEFLDKFFIDDNEGLGWIVDNYYINSVPSKNLLGYVGPDFTKSLKNCFINENKNSKSVFKLDYKFYKK